MLIRFGSTTLLATLLTAALAGGCTVSTSDDDSSASLTIDNNESFAITDIYISPSGSYVTSDNLLSEDLQPGDSLTVDVTCDMYDVEIIDATGTDCYIADYSLCGTDDQWDLDDAFFDDCASTEPRAPGQGNVTHISNVNASHLKQ